jgi:hypothetical protein
VLIAPAVAVTSLLSACSNGILPVALFQPPPEARELPPPPPPVPPEEEAASEEEAPAPNRTRAAIVRWFIQAGYKRFQAEALADHARIESGFNPCVSGAGFRYLFQWSGERARRLAAFAGSRGCPALEKQLAFADNELRTEPAYSCFWRATSEVSALAALRRGFGGGHC